MSQADDRVRLSKLALFASKQKSATRKGSCFPSHIWYTIQCSFWLYMLYSFTGHTIMLLCTLQFCVDKVKKWSKKTLAYFSERQHLLLPGLLLSEERRAASSF